jgi:hypothetical protein
LLTLSHTHTAQNSSFYTNKTIEQRRTTPQHHAASTEPKQLAAANPRHLLFYGWVHRATNIRKTDSTNTTMATLVPA